MPHYRNTLFVVFALVGSLGCGPVEGSTPEPWFSGFKLAAEYEQSFFVYAAGDWYGLSFDTRVCAVAADADGQLDAAGAATFQRVIGSPRDVEPYLADSMSDEAYELAHPVRDGGEPVYVVWVAYRDADGDVDPLLARDRVVTTRSMAGAETTELLDAVDAILEPMLADARPRFDAYLDRHRGADGEVVCPPEPFSEPATQP